MVHLEQSDDDCIWIYKAHTVSFLKVFPLFRTFQVLFCEWMRSEMSANLGTRSNKCRKLKSCCKVTWKVDWPGWCVSWGAAPQCCSAQLRSQQQSGLCITFHLFTLLTILSLSRYFRTCRKPFMTIYREINQNVIEYFWRSLKSIQISQVIKKLNRAINTKSAFQWKHFFAVHSEKCYLNWSDQHISSIWIKYLPDIDTSISICAP